jgi:hypothetical protein
LATVVLLLGVAVTAQQLPSTNPDEVWVKGRIVGHSWRDGRIWVPTAELQPLLDVSSEMPSMDLIKTLEEKGGYIWNVEGGVFQALRDPANYSTGGRSAQVTTQGGARTQRQPATASRQAPATSGGVKKAQPNQLTALVQKFVAEETGYVRAWVMVTNSGAQLSDPSLMIVEFQDAYHYAWGHDEKAVPALNPGESQVYECFSMVPDEVKNVEGVQRTMNGDQVVCKFRSLTNPDNDDKDQVRKENRRGRKIEVTRLKTSPLPTFRIGP